MLKLGGKPESLPERRRREPGLVGEGGIPEKVHLVNHDQVRAFFLPCWWTQIGDGVGEFIIRGVSTAEQLESDHNTNGFSCFPSLSGAAEAFCKAARK